MRRRRAIRLLAAALLGATVVACGSASEPVDPAPATARLFDATGRELTPAPALARGATTRVEVRLYAENGGRITGLEARHHATLAFDAPAIVVTPVAGQPFLFDVAPPAAGAASLTVRYDDGALDFGPFAVTVQ